MSKIKLSLGKSRESGDSKALFIDRKLLMDYPGDHCLREQDFSVKLINFDSLLDIYNNYDYLILISHAPEVAKAWMTEKELRKMNDKIIQQLLKYKLAVDATMNCIHSPDDEGLMALCIPCSCHPSRGGMYLEAAVKYKLSLSQSAYLALEPLKLEAELGLEYIKFPCD